MKHNRRMDFEYHLENLEYQGTDYICDVLGIEPEELLKVFRLRAERWIETEFYIDDEEDEDE